MANNINRASLITDMIDNCNNILNSIDEESELFQYDAETQAEMIEILKLEKLATLRLSAALQNISINQSIN